MVTGQPFHHKQVEIGDGSWRLYANCQGTDPELWFPERGASTREAKQICFACPVRLQCLEYALVNGEKFGIFGGVSERGRRKMRIQRNQARRVS